MSKKTRSPGRRLAGAVMLFYFLAFLLLSSRDRSPLGYILCVAVPAMIWAGTFLLPRMFRADNLLLSLTNFLCALGVLVLYDTHPAYALQQVIAYGIGLGCMIFCIYLVRSVRSWRGPVLILIPASLLLLSLPLILGKEINGARNWVSFGSVSFQPSEVVKLSLVLILSWFMSRRRMLPWLLFGAACLGLLMLQKDLGTALIYYTTALALYWCASGDWILTLLGILGGCGTAVLGYTMFVHVRLRVTLWLNPFADYANTGYQIVQGLMAIASGGLFGVGLGLGAPTSIPVYQSDYIFAVICEQFGLVFGACVLLMYVALVLRGAAVAVSARRSFHGLLAMSCVILLGFQAFIIIGGVLKLIPLTGVTMPFVSYGGTSLISCMCMMGFVQGVASLNEDDLEEDAHLARLER